MKQIFLYLWNLIHGALDLIAPQRCVICGRRLHAQEDTICLKCFSSLPFTRIHGKRENKIEKIFWGKIPICRANALLYYLPHAESTHIFLKLKYGNRPHIGYTFGKIMAKDLADSDFFEGITRIIPLPLAKERLEKRGYNQSETIAKGISSITSIPLDTHSVIRAISNPTQTTLSHEERQNNVKNIFQLVSDHQLDNQHVLLVDDILTTGATLLSCAQEIAKAEHVKISIITLGLAGFHFSIHRQEP